VLAHYVLQHYKDNGDVIAFIQIPPKLNAPLKIARKRRKKDDFDQEEVEEKPKKNQKRAKKDKKAKASELVAPDLQEEVADLEPVQVLEKRTRGGTSEADSPARKKKKVVKEPPPQTQRVSRRLKLSAEQTEELASEERSTLAQVVEKNHVEASQKLVDLTEQLQQTTVEEVGEILKAQMQVKRESKDVQRLLPHMLVFLHMVIMLFTILSQTL